MPAYLLAVVRFPMILIPAKSFQHSAMGSIPIARSINHDDSIVLTPLNQLINAVTAQVDFWRYTTLVLLLTRIF